MLSVKSFTQHKLCGIWVNQVPYSSEYQDVIIIKEVCNNKIVGNSYDQDERGGFCNYRLVGTYKEKANEFIVKANCSFAYEKKNHVPTSVKLKLSKTGKIKVLRGKKWISGVGMFFPKTLKNFKKISLSEFKRNTSYTRLKFYLNKLEGCECVKKIKDSLESTDRLEERENKLVKKLEVDEPELILKLRDKNKSDGDKVSIYLNGELVVSEYEVTKKKKKIKLILPYGKEENKLVFVADNLGKVPPNTADIEIKSGKQKYNISLNCDLKKNNQILIIKK